MEKPNPRSNRTFFLQIPSNSHRLQAGCVIAYPLSGLFRVIDFNVEGPMADATFIKFSNVNTEMPTEYPPRLPLCLLSPFLSLSHYRLDLYHDYVNALFLRQNLRPDTNLTRAAKVCFVLWHFFLFYSDFCRAFWLSFYLLARGIVGRTSSDTCHGNGFVRNGELASC